MSEYLLMSACKKLTKQGKDYFDLVLSTPTENITGKFWNGYPDMSQYVEKVLDIDGSLSEFNGEMQLTVNAFDVTDEDPIEFCKKTKFNIEQMYAKVQSIIASCKNPELRGILEQIFAECGEEFKKHSGAVKIHHAFVGGLLQHTLCVATCAMKLCDVYQMADKDIVITAALLHDIGKLEEITKFPSLDYTREGVCLGHVMLSTMKVGKYADQISDSLVRDKLMNCIAGHHGTKEWGSPALPACIEAYIVHVSDLLDSRIEILLEESEKLETGEVSSRVYALGGSIIGV